MTGVGAQLAEGRERFFLPGARSAEEAEEVLAGIKKWASETLGAAASEIGDARIFRLDYRHDSSFYVAEVGQDEPRTRELVVAILDGGPNLYLVCTPNRGVLRGMPILVGRHAARSVTLFDDSSQRMPAENS